MRRFGKFGVEEDPLVTIQMANSLLRQFASDAVERDPGCETPHQAEQWAVGTGDMLCSDKQQWWQCPQAVADWCVPFGAVLNLMQVPTHGGGGGRPGKDRCIVNVVASRRANVKNNFFSILNASTSYEKWSAQTTNMVGVQYSVESCEVKSTRHELRSVPVVMLSMVLIDDPAILRPLSSDQEGALTTIERIKRGRSHAPNDSIRVSIAGGVNKPRVYPESGFEKFLDNPLGWHEHRVITPIGRVLHSPPRAPTAHEALASCHDKKVYDALKPMEIELGCP